MNIEKDVNEEGVAVLISPGFGAGWSTWNDGDIKELLLFDKTLVAMVGSASEDEVRQYIKGRTGLEHACTIGWENVKVRRLPPGERFVVREYDGHESFETADSLVHIA